MPFVIKNSKRSVNKNKPTSYILLYSLHLPILAVLLIVALVVLFGGKIASSKASVESATSTAKFTLIAGKDQLATNKIVPLEKVLVLTLAYDMNSITPLKITQTYLKNGYASKTNGFVDNYVLQLISSNGSIVERTYFTIPNRITETANTEVSQHQAEVLLTKVNFAQSIKWVKDAKKLRVMNSDGALITEYDLANTKQLNNLPSFKTIEVEAQGHTRSVQPSSIQSSEQQETVDVVFIGDDYGTVNDLEKFHNDVAKYIGELLLYEPIRSRVSQFSFHLIDNTADLGCGANPSWGTALYCDNDKAYNIATNSGVPLDKLIIIYNTTDFFVANAATGAPGQRVDCCVRLASSEQFHAFTHEFGHLLGNLKDEYLYSNYDETMDNSVVENCYRGNAQINPPAVWATLVGKEDYTKGCSSPNWYRTSAHSIMTGSMGYFNTVSQKLLNESIDFYAGTFSDATSPTGSLTAPLDGASLYNHILFKYSASDNNGIARIQLWRDGEFIYTDYNQLLDNSFNWSLVNETEEPHTYQLKIFDISGNVWESPIVTVNVIDDPTLPSAFILTPQSNVIVTGIITIQADAIDESNLRASEVQLFVDGILKGTSSAYPFNFQWDTDSEKAGNHSVEVHASNNSGETWKSEPINIIVRSEDDSEPPVLTLTEPKMNQQVSDIVEIKATATDNNNNVSEVRFFIDNELKGTDNISPYTFSWDTNTTSLGNHSINAGASDSSNNYVETDPVVVKVVRSIDTKPPVVLIDKPLNNTRVPSSGDTKIVVYASDNRKVKTMKILVNNKLVYTCNDRSICKMAINNSTLRSGNNSIKVTARDAAGNTGSAQVNIIKR